MKRVLVFSALSLCLTAGCGGPAPNYAALELVDVRGVVKLDGSPVAGAVVAFEDLANGNESYGLTDSSGRYRLSFNSEKYGIMPGDKKVTVSTARKVLGLNAEEGGGEVGEAPGEGEAAGSKPMETIPDAYRGKDSKLRVKVDGSTKTFNFNLAADGSTTSAE